MVTARDPAKSHGGDRWKMTRDSEGCVKGIDLIGREGGRYSHYRIELC